MRNPIYQAFPKIIDDAFRETLFLGADLSSPISDEDSTLYEVQRLDFYAGRVPAHVRETELFARLTADSGNGGALIIVSAPRGGGKTTFLRFFFGRFLQKSVFRERLDRVGFTVQCVLSLSLQRGANRRSVEQMWQNLSIDIRHRYRNIESEDCYRLWDRIEDWDSDVHRHACGDSTRESYRAKIAVSRNHHDFVFCKEALRYISQTRRDHLIVLVVDDIDHLSADVVFEIAQSLRDIAEDSGIRVVLPMRPETMAYLTERGVATGRSSVLSIGIAYEPGVVERRGKFAKRAVRVGQCESYEVVPVEQYGGGVTYIPLSPIEAERKVESLVNGGRLERIEDVKFAWSVMRGLVGHSIRGALRMRKRLAKNGEFFRVLNRNNENRGSFRTDEIRLVSKRAADEFPTYEPSNYDIFRGILCGGDEAFYGNDAECDISDVFSLGVRASFDSRCLLGGPILLQLLRGGIESVNTIQEKLRLFCVPSHWIELLLENFSSVGIIHRFDSPNIKIEQDIVESYAKLIYHPAYTDSVSDRIVWATCGGRRVESGLGFGTDFESFLSPADLDLRAKLALEFIRVIGAAWRSSLQSIRERSADQRLPRWMRSLGIRSPGSLIRESYFQRLKQPSVCHQLSDRSLVNRFRSRRESD